MDSYSRPSLHLYRRNFEHIHLAVNLNYTELANATDRNGTFSAYPAPIGALSLDSFIYIIIGAIVFLITIKFLIDFLRSLRDPPWVEIAAIIELDSEIRLSTPVYLDQKPRPVPRIEGILKAEIVKQKNEPRYFRPFPEPDPIPVFRPDLPLPVITDVAAEEYEEPKPTITEQEVVEWQKLIKERLKLRTTIANLQRIKQANQRRGVSTGIAKLEAAVERKRFLDASIAAMGVAFRSLKEEWDPEEWRMIEQIEQRLKEPGPEGQ